MFLQFCKTDIHVCVVKQFVLSTTCILEKIYIDILFYMPNEYRLQVLSINKYWYPLFPQDHYSFGSKGQKGHNLKSMKPVDYIWPSYGLECIYKVTVFYYFVPFRFVDAFSFSAVCLADSLCTFKYNISMLKIKCPLQHRHEHCKVLPIT